MFYVQHGYGKAAKIEDCAATGFVDGVILSPGHESAATLRETVRRCGDLGLKVLLDPQTYIYSTRPPGELRHHADHGLDLDHLGWAMTPVELTGSIDSVAAANRAAHVQAPWLSPGPFHRSLTDYWMPASIQLARTAAQHWGGQVIVTLAVDESVLGDWDRLSEWLDVLTTLDVSGFYLVVSRRSVQYPPTPWEPESLAHLLRLIYVLSVVNQYEVTWGYADIDGLLGIAAGADVVASGWSYGLRQFNIERYSERRAGGAQPVPRLLLPSLMSDVRSTEAADLFHDMNDGAALFPTDLQTTFQARSFDSLTNPEAQAQHLAAVAEAVHGLAQYADLRDRLAELEHNIGAALDHHARIHNAGFVLEPKYANRLRNYRDALKLFRASVGL